MAVLNELYAVVRSHLRPSRQGVGKNRIFDYRRLGVGICTSTLIILGAAPGRADGPAYQVYQYDSLGNLVGSWDSAGRNAQFRYDQAENRTQNSVAVGAAPTPPSPPAPVPVPAQFKLILLPGQIAIIPWGN